MTRITFFRLTAIFLLLPLFTLCSSGNRELQSKRTVIAGKIENMVGNSTTLIVNLCDPLSEESRFVQDLTTSAGTFSVAHDYVFAQNITVRYGNSFVNLYLVPGDSIFITIDGSKLGQHPDDAVLFSGDRAEINEQLSRWTNYAYRLPIPDFNPAAPPDEYLQCIRAHFRAMRDTIDRYAQRHEMNDFVKQWAYTDYKFVTANCLLDYEDKASKWSVFTDPVFDVYHERNFRSMCFAYHLGACILAFVSGNRDIQDLLDRKEYSAAFRAVIKDLPANTPKGTVRDMMIYRFACRILNENPALYDSIPGWDTVFSQPVFHERIKSFVQEKSAGAEKPVPRTGKTVKGVSYFDGETQQVTTLADIEVLPYVCERYKNKVLYIDVWATWCGPCLAEMKYAPALHEFFAGKEDVVFVNLCLESTVEKWLEAIRKDVVKGENYYLDENASKIFMGTHQIGGFPTFLLVDKNGQLHAPVAQPSNTLSAIDQIQSLLRK